MKEITCCHHGYSRHRHNRLRRCLAGVFIISVTAALILVITWAVIQPQKPHFVLQDATIFVLNVSSPNVISTNVQVTVTSRNPNSMVGIYYEDLHSYAMYRGQQITGYAFINSVYQGHKDINVWSPFLQGTNVPVAPFNGLALSQEPCNGGIRMTVKVDGTVKWKVGTLVTGRFHLHVTCPAIVPLGCGIEIGNAIKYQLSETCSVSV